MPQAPTAPTSPNPAAAPPSSAPQQAPSAPPENYRPTAQSEDPFADLDKLEDPAPPASPAPAKPESGTKKPAGETKPPAGETKPGSGETKPAAGETPGFKTPKELRQAYEARGTELETAKKSLSEMEAKLKALEADTGNTAKLEAQLAEAIAAKEKQITDLQEKIMGLSYEHSDEYDVKYAKPYEKGLSKARALATQLVANDGEGGKRQGTAADFDRILALPPQEAIGVAEQLFGKAGDLLIRERDKLRDIYEAAREAVNERRETAATRHKEQLAKEAREREAQDHMFRRVTEDYTNRYPKNYQEDKDDPEGNKLLKRGFEMADLFFNGRESLSPQQRVILDARMRLQAAAFPRMAHRAKRLESQVAELTAKLAEFEKSGDLSDGRKGGPPPKTGAGDWESDFDSKVPG